LDEPLLNLDNSVFDLDELPSRIKTIFSSKVENETTHPLTVDDAQTLIDTIDKARSAIANALAETDIGMFHRLDTGHARPFTLHPKEMS
jgi:hypothetical protein